MTQSLIKEVTKPSFETSDGRKFPTIEEAQAHLTYIENTELIETFFVVVGVQKAQAGLLRRLLPQFMAHWNEFEPAVVADEAAKV